MFTQRYIGELQIYFVQVCDCAEWLTRISLQYLCLNINTINLYHHLVCHKAFTEAKNHKHIYTLINIIKNMVQQWLFLFSRDMGAKHVNITWI